MPLPSTLEELRNRQRWAESVFGDGPREPAVDVRALVVNGTGQAVAFDHAPDSVSAARAGTDLTNPDVGLLGFEIEVATDFELRTDAPGQGETLVEGTYLTVVVDGVRNDLPEIVTKPGMVFDEERGAPNLYVILAESRDAWQRLLNAARTGGGTLGEAFANSDFTVTPKWQNLRMHDWVTRFAGAVQYSVGVPVERLYPFLRFVLDHHFEEYDQKRTLAARFLRDGLDFGALVARKVAARLPRDGALGEPGVSLAGFLALVYSHAAALAYGISEQRSVPKSRVLALSRLDLDNLRHALSPPVRAFIELSAPWIIDRFESFLAAREPQVVSEGRRVAELQSRLPVGQSNLLDASGTLARSDDPYRLGDLLDTALRARPDSRLGQAALGVHTVLAQPEGGGRPARLRNQRPVPAARLAGPGTRRTVRRTGAPRRDRAVRPAGHGCSPG